MEAGRQPKQGAGSGSSASKAGSCASWRQSDHDVCLCRLWAHACHLQPLLPFRAQWRITCNRRQRAGSAASLLVKPCGLVGGTRMIPRPPIPPTCNRPSSSGGGTKRMLVKRPGRSSAPSMAAGRLVAASTSTPGHRQAGRHDGVLCVSMRVRACVYDHAAVCAGVHVWVCAVRGRARKLQRAGRHDFVRCWCLSHAFRAEKHQRCPLGASLDTRAPVLQQHCRD